MTARAKGGQEKWLPPHVTDFRLTKPNYFRAQPRYVYTHTHTRKTTRRRYLKREQGPRKKSRHPSDLGVHFKQGETGDIFHVAIFSRGGQPVRRRRTTRGPRMALKPPSLTTTRNAPKASRLSSIEPPIANPHKRFGSIDRIFWPC